MFFSSCGCEAARQYCYPDNRRRNRAIIYTGGGSTEETDYELNVNSRGNDFGELASFDDDLDDDQPGGEKKSVPPDLDRFISFGPDANILAPHGQGKVGRPSAAESSPGDRKSRQLASTLTMVAEYEEELSEQERERSKKSTEKSTNGSTSSTGGGGGATSSSNATAAGTSSSSGAMNKSTSENSNTTQAPRSTQSQSDSSVIDIDARIAVIDSEKEKQKEKKPPDDTDTSTKNTTTPVVKKASKVEPKISVVPESRSSLGAATSRHSETIIQKLNGEWLNTSQENFEGVMAASGAPWMLRKAAKVMNFGVNKSRHRFLFEDIEELDLKTNTTIPKTKATITHVGGVAGGMEFQLLIDGQPREVKGPMGKAVTRAYMTDDVFVIEIQPAKGKRDVVKRYRIGVGSVVEQLKHMTMLAVKQIEIAHCADNKAGAKQSAETSKTGESSTRTQWKCNGLSGKRISPMLCVLGCGKGSQRLCQTESRRHAMCYKCLFIDNIDIRIIRIETRRMNERSRTEAAPIEVSEAAVLPSTSTTHQYGAVRLANPNGVPNGYSSSCWTVFFFALRCCTNEKKQKLDPVDESPALWCNFEKAGDEKRKPGAVR
ncbi:unnamed protein product, partial [Amoebophrya sp. A120]|eukprot:GSA120T00007787001.1